MEEEEEVSECKDGGAGHNDKILTVCDMAVRARVTVLR